MLRRVWKGMAVGSRITLFDGGTGEELFKRGVEQDRDIWSAVAIKKPEYHGTVVDVHRSYIEAGCDVLTANNFGVTPGVGFGLADMMELSAKAVELAKEARDGAGREHVRVACSLPPLVESYRPDLVMSDEAKGMDIYRQLGLATARDADVFMAETLSSVREMSMAVSAVQNLGKPIFASWTLREDGRLRSGETVTEAALTLLELTETSQCLEGIMFNCCEPESVGRAFNELLTADNPARAQMLKRSVKLGASPNALTPVDPNWTMAENPEPQPFRTDLNPSVFVTSFARAWARQIPSGLILGGCCGLGPEYISALNKLRQDLSR
mmetsp:Transcript_40425/g.160480  ORF Transcript_40425/g.160480 Transcript_40425/m.160480 type:complete len:325 (-) Transcript_40425:2004-2978(-)